MSDIKITSQTSLTDLQQLVGDGGVNLKGKKVDGKLVLYASKNGVGLRARILSSASRRAKEKQQHGREALAQVLNNRFGGTTAAQIMKGLRSALQEAPYVNQAIIARAAQLGEQIEDRQNDNLIVSLPNPPGDTSIRDNAEFRIDKLKTPRLFSHDPELLQKLGTVSRRSKAFGAKAGKAEAGMRALQQGLTATQIRIRNRKHASKQIALMNKADSMGSAHGFRGLVDEALRRIEKEQGKVDPARLPEEKSRNGDFTAAGRRTVREAINAEFKAHTTEVPDTAWARREVAIEAIKAHLVGDED